MKPSQTVDMHDVETYLKTRKLVDERQLPYYIRWIQRFLLNDEGVRRLAPNDALAAFTQHLEQDARTEEWQVRQAVRAVELFQKHNLRHLQETGATVPASAVAGQADASEKPTTFAAALGEARTLIRLRHYAYRTEQAYLEWLTRYGRFATAILAMAGGGHGEVLPRGPGDPTGRGGIDAEPGRVKDKPHTLVSRSKLK